MQPAQTAYENMKGYVAQLGASMDASRAITMDMAKMLETAPNASVAKAFRNIGAESAITDSLRGRGSFFESVGQSATVQQAVESTTQRRSKGFDDQFGAGVDIERVDPRAALAELKRIDPARHEVLINNAKAQAQDLAALERISPSTAKKQADTVIFGNAKCSALAQHAVALQIKAINPSTQVLENKSNHKM